MPLKSSIAAIRREIRSAAGQGVKRAAGHVANLAQQLCPVDTGALKASIEVRDGATETQYRVTAGGGTVDYAAFVEYGTSRSPAQPFLTPAAKAIDVDREVAVELETLYRRHGL